jgi:hypothetical protein
MMAARNILAAALVLALVGCVSTPRTTAPQGNYLPGGIDQSRLAADAVRQLAALYPPARTSLSLQQPASDPFGAALLKGLRASGYAVAEVPAVPAKPAGAPQAQAGTPLYYVVDPAGPVYRVMLTVGSESLSRAYVAPNGTVVPAGQWVRKE